ncbi:MAG: oligosaccharide flippase family protein [Leptolyngbyaceae cyanobacterium CSU_1_3]|nr:oligosaccharide flippase family protein [Leptolyngbyaceae cyanobacterium CSU_1_3]
MHTTQPLTLRHNFSWTFLGNVVYAGCQWVMLVVLAKLGTPEMVGQFTLGLTVTAPIMLLCNMQLRAIQATDTQGQYQFADYFSLRLVTTAIALGVIIGVILLGGYRGDAAWVILAIGIAKAIESISDIFHGFLQQQERMNHIAISMIGKGILSIAALSIAVYLTQNIVWGVMGLVAAWTIVLLWYDRPNFHRMQGILERNPLDRPSSLNFRWRTKTLLRLSWASLPLGFVMMLISLNTNLPRYFIEHYLGQRELGIFAAMTYFQVVGTTVISALGQSASPRLAKESASEGQQGFRRLLLKLIGIASGLGLLGALIAAVAGHRVLSLLYSPEFAEHSDLLVRLMVAAALWYITSILGYAATAKRKIRKQPIVLLTTILISALSCYWLVPTAGLLGAANSMLITSAVAMVGYFWLLIF